MYQFAMCDDDKAFLKLFSKKLQLVCQSLHISAKITMFENARVFLKQAQNQTYHAAFLDIEMPEMNGFMLANRLDMDYLIFLTNHSWLVYESFRFDPIWFLQKDEILQGNDVNLQRALVKLCKKIETQRKDYVLKRVKDVVRIPLQDLIYVESQNHIIQFYCKNQEVYAQRKSLAEVEQEVGEEGFIRTHSGYLVNYRYIASFTPGEVVLQNGMVLPVSRRRSEQVQQQFQQFMRMET